MDAIATFAPPPREELERANQVSTLDQSPRSSVTAASVFALWILIPLALGGLAYMAIGLWLMRDPYDPNAAVDARMWLPLTLILQTAYWVLLAHRSGTNAIKGLWGLLPIIGLIPTFGIARNVNKNSGSPR